MPWRDTWANYSLMDALFSPSRSMGRTKYLLQHFNIRKTEFIASIARHSQNDEGPCWGSSSMLISPTCFQNGVTGVRRFAYGESSCSIQVSNNHQSAVRNFHPSLHRLSEKKGDHPPCIQRIAQVSRLTWNQNSTWGRWRQSWTGLHAHELTASKMTLDTRVDAHASFSQR